MADAVITEVDGGIAVITINRPEARNAVNGEVARGIATAVEELDGSNDIRVLILTGAGGYFSAGMDLKGFLTGDSPLAEGRGFAGIVERPPVKPVIAAVEGYALAGGFEIALTGEHFSAERLHQAGLISRLVGAGQALAGARELAATVAQGAPLALAATKRVIVESPDWPSDEAFARQGEVINPVFTSADAMEGAAAFAEKRPPVWRGQ